MAFLCGDVLDPPLEAEQFQSVIASNLLDSVRDPLNTIGQAHALTAKGGLLTFSAPFAWREEVTPRGDWLESIAPTPDGSAEDVVRGEAELSHCIFNFPKRFSALTQEMLELLDKSAFINTAHQKQKKKRAIKKGVHNES